MRRHERNRRRTSQHSGVGSAPPDGPSDPLLGLRVTVALDAPPCAHCAHYHRQHDPPRPCDGACCDCGARNPDLEIPS